MENIDKWINISVTILGSLMGLATLITGLTNSEKDDAIVSKIRYTFNKLFGLTTYKDAAGTFKFPLQDPARGVMTPIKAKKK